VLDWVELRAWGDDFWGRAKVTVRGEHGWQGRESRAFSLAKPVRFCSYRLAFPGGRKVKVRVAERNLPHERSVRMASRHNALPQCTSRCGIIT
jgi:hypothetical protein